MTERSRPPDVQDEAEKIKQEATAGARSPVVGGGDAAREVIFCAGNPLDALQAPASYKIALSADLNHGPESDEPWTSTAFAGAFLARRQPVYAWCDCRPEGGTAADEAIRLALDLYLLGWYGQAESAEQFDHAVERGHALGLPPVALVGNLSALRSRPDRTNACIAAIMLGGHSGRCVFDNGHDGLHVIDQLDLVARALVLFLNETYFNVQPGLQPDWRGANAGVGGNCVAVYASESEGAVYTPLAGMVADGRFIKGRDSIYAPGMQPLDWKAA